MSDSKKTGTFDNTSVDNTSVIPLIKSLNKRSASKMVFGGLIALTANTVFAESVFPSALVTKRGTTTSQSLDVLKNNALTGTADNSAEYIEFAPNRYGYIGVFTFNVPVDPNETIQGLTFNANFKGPAKPVQSWNFQILNVSTGKWVKLADNSAAQDWTWSNIISSSLTSPGTFINSKNQVTIRYSTGSNADVSQLDYVALDVNSATTTTTTTTPTPPTPTSTTNNGRWQPVPGMKWQIQYEGTLDTSLNVDIYNIDLFDTPASTISALRSSGKHVICYFSAGSYENWRPDASKFPASVLGSNLDGWAGEKWLDVRQLNVLIPIMQARMQLAADKGCDAVDPDNVDGYNNKSGFTLSYNDQLAYNRALAAEAHKLDLAVSLKNDLDQIKDLVNDVDFAVNEECFQYAECDLLKPFVSVGKPVFGIEYSLSTTSFCSQANTMNFDFLKKNLSLDAWRQSCR